MQGTARRWGWLLAAVAAAMPFVASQSGCVSALATALYVIKGDNRPAQFDGLKGRRVAVVCRPVVELEYSSSGAAADIAVHVSRLLKENVRKIKLVDPREVANWTDENTWHEFTEIGSALGAELVLGIDLEGFSLYQGQTLYQGNAIVRLAVYDVATGETVFERALPPSVFPPNHAIATQDKTEDAFRRQFVAVVSDEIGRYFYPHDAHADFGKDVAALD